MDGVRRRLPRGALRQRLRPLRRRGEPVPPAPPGRSRGTRAARRAGGAVAGPGRAEPVRVRRGARRLAVTAGPAPAPSLLHLFHDFKSQLEYTSIQGHLTVHSLVCELAVDVRTDSTDPRATAWILLARSVLCGRPELCKSE